MSWKSASYRRHRYVSNTQNNIETCFGLDACTTFELFAFIVTQDPLELLALARMVDFRVPKQR
jgi:hypothetical protein